jgi:hypothetical protein
MMELLISSFQQDLEEDLDIYLDWVIVTYGVPYVASVS